MGLFYESSSARNDKFISKEELRKNLLEAMCVCAREISHKKTYYQICSVDFDGKWPRVFNPGTSDKLIFSQIIDWNLDDIKKKGSFRPEEINGIAARMMAKFYYPLYGQWDHDSLD